MFKKRKSSANIKRQSRNRSQEQSSSKNVFSYHSKRSQSEAPRPRNDVFDQETKKVNRSAKHIPSIIALIIIVCSIGYSLLLDTEQPVVIPLSDSSNTPLRSSDFYQSKIAEIMTSSPLSRTKLTIDTSSVESEILAALPELDKVSVNIPLLGKQPVVQISGAKPSLIIDSSTNSYVIGANGRALMRLSDLPENQKSGLIRVQDAVAGEVAVGDAILPIATIDFINSLKYQFESAKMGLDYIQLPAIANELHVRVKDKPYVVRFNLQEDVREQAGRYFALAQKMNTGEIPQAQEYVDVRVDGRAYYK